MQGQRILNRLWQWLSEDRRLIEILAALSAIYFLILILPQAPMSPNSGPVFVRWLTQQRDMLGVWTGIFSRIGLLSLRTSIWLRAVLGLLVLILAVRCVSRRSRAFRLATALICVGGLLFLAGWGMHTLWGWAEDSVFTWPESPVEVPDRQLLLPVPRSPLQFWTPEYGVYLLPKKSSVGLEIQARSGDAEENLLSLQSTVHSAPESLLRIALTPQSPEAYFALLDAGLIFRIQQRNGAAPELWLQVYRSASGELLAERRLEDEGKNMKDEVVVDVEDIHLFVEQITLSQFAVVYNPGAPLQVAGALLFAAGTFWTWSKREDDEEQDDSEDS